MKKALPFLGMILCVFMAGCSKGASSGGGGAVTITVGGWPSGDDAFEAALPGFSEKYPNIKVEFEFIDTTSHHQALQTSLAAGQAAQDVAMVEGAYIAQYRDSSALVNFLEAPYNAEKYKNDFVAYKWEQCYSSNRKQLVTIPWDIGPCSYFYRSDIFESVGLPSDPAEVAKLMSTWAGVLEVAKKVHIPGERWLIPNAAYLYFEYFIDRDYYDSDLNLILEREGDLACLDAVIEMRKNKWDMNVDMWSSEAYAAYASGAVASVATGCWFGGFLKKDIDPDGAGHWRTTTLPGAVPASNWGGSFLVIPKQSKHKEEAWAFIEYMLATVKGQNDMFLAVDYFPAYIPAWKDTAIYEAGDPYFGGQKTKALWAQIASELQPVYTTIMDTTAEGYIYSSVNAGLEQGLDARGIRNLVASDINTATEELKRQQIQTLREAGVWNK